MKRILNIFIYFLVLTFTITLSLLSESNTAYSQLNTSTGCIKVIERENVSLITNNHRSYEITSPQEENNQSFSDLTPFVLAFQPIDNIFHKTKTLLNGCFIHNLSTDKQKTDQIRAP